MMLTLAILITVIARAATLAPQMCVLNSNAHVCSKKTLTFLQ